MSRADLAALPTPPLRYRGQRLTAPSDFELTLEEAATSGLTLTDGVLVIRATLAGRALSLLLLAMGAGFAAGGVVAISGGSSGAGAVLGSAAMYWAAVGWRCMTAHIRADVGGLTVRNHWRTYRFGWAEVAALSVDEEYRPWGWLPYSSCFALPHTFVAGLVLTTGGRTVYADALASVAAVARALHAAPPAQSKIGALRRWRDSITV